MRVFYIVQNDEQRFFVAFFGQGQHIFNFGIGGGGYFAGNTAVIRAGHFVQFFAFHGVVGYTFGFAQIDNIGNIVGLNAFSQPDLVYGKVGAQGFAYGIFAGQHIFIDGAAGGAFFRLFSGAAVAAGCGFAGGAGTAGGRAAGGTCAAFSCGFAAFGGGFAGSGFCHILSP